MNKLTIIDSAWYYMDETPIDQKSENEFHRVLATFLDNYYDNPQGKIIETLKEKYGIEDFHFINTYATNFLEGLTLEDALKVVDLARTQFEERRALWSDLKEEQQL